MCSVCALYLYVHSESVGTHFYTQLGHCQGGDKLTLNLSGAVLIPTPVLPTPSKTPSPTTPIVASNSPFSSLPNGVSVTHYSEQRGEMISIPATPSAHKASPKVDNTTRAENLISLDTDLTVQTVAHHHPQQPHSPTKAHNNNNPFLNMSPQLPQTPTNAAVSSNSTNPFKSTPPPAASNSSPVSNNSHAHSLAPTSLSVQQQNSYASVVVSGNPFKETNGSSDTTKASNLKNQQSSDVVDAEKVSSFGLRNKKLGILLKILTIIENIN